MGFLQRFQRKKDREDVTTVTLQEPFTEPPLEMETPSYNLEDTSQREQFIKSQCEIIVECDKQIEEAKLEYEQVTAYLTDIQKIDRIAGEEREGLNLLCKHLIQLEKERTHYKGKKIEITDAQIRRFDPYQDVLGEEVKKMFANEAYQGAIKHDLQYLESEKAGLFYEKEGIIEGQRDLKTVAKVLMVFFVSLCALFLVIYYGTGTDMTIPYMATMVLAALAAAVIVNESHRNKRAMKQNDLKLNRAITLQNRVKIKYINNTNVLDYTCEKYGVNSASEFETLYNAYCAAKDCEEKLVRNTEQTHKNQTALLAVLRNAQVTDQEIWLHQLEAIVDNREMVEVRHRLNVRRRSLRERVTFNKENKEHSFMEVAKVLKMYPQARGQIADTLREFGITARGSGV